MSAHDAVAAWSRETLAVAAGRPDLAGAPLNPAVVLASNIRASGDYSRTNGTETWEALESAVGALEGGQAIAYASGMAAAAAALFALAPRVVVVPAASYMGVRALLAEHAAQGHLELRPVDITDTPAVVRALDGADVLWIETPTNPTLEVADLAALCGAATDRSVRTVVDSTFATPLRQRPLEHGATIVMHSATKFIGGHSDLLLGLCITDDDDVHARLVDARTFQGGTPGALESFLALRGLRTLPVRLAAAEANARVLVERLATHPAVAEVRYPGDGAMLAVIMAGDGDDARAAADRLCERVRLAVPATSLGGVETTLERRQKYPGDAHVHPGLVRVSVGIESLDDLWADLAQALDG
jgi:cystathionine gamma-synthase